MAVVTDQFTKIMAEKLLNDFDSAGNTYFVGISRAGLWNDSDVTIQEVNSPHEVRAFRDRLMAVKQINDASFVIPRFNWSSGTIYQAWNDKQVDYPTNGYYVYTQTNDVYICIEQGKNALGQAVASTVEPTGTGTSPIQTADGYTWKYLYSMSSLELSRFVAANYIPVQFIDSSDGSIREDAQVAVQNAATAGEIANIVVTNGGTGYSSAPTVTISGDGTGAAATATISGGSVVKIEMTNRGSGYTRASVSFSSGAATARAVLAPTGGFGANPIVDLKANAIMFNARPTGDEGGTWPLDQDFRQIGLYRNPQTTADSDFVQSTGNALDYLRFNPGATAFSADTIIVGGTSSARGYIVTADSAAGVYYYQSDSTGYVSFQSGESLSAVDRLGGAVTGSAVLDSVVPATFDKYSGDVLYVDNRSAIVRSAGETQDVKIIIQL